MTLRARIAILVRRVIGAPDYETYLAHVRTHHPTEQPLPKEEFFRQRLEDRYNRVGSRCC